MTIKYNLQGSLTINPVWWKDPPKINVMLNETCLYTGALESLCKIDFDKDLSRGYHRLCVEFFGKTDDDTDVSNKKDKAIIVESLEFFGISSQRFVWQGLYQPIYPEIWYKEQTEKGILLEPVLKHHNYLGWNGSWYVDLYVPIFTWIHKVENLGWIHAN